MNEYVVLLKGKKDDTVIKAVGHVRAITPFMALIGAINEFHSKYQDLMIIDVKMFEV